MREDAIEACEAALRLVAKWREGWNGACRFAEWSPQFEILTDCADELLQALAPYVRPQVDAVGVVDWPEHPSPLQEDYERAKERNAQIPEHARLIVTHLGGRAPSPLAKAWEEGVLHGESCPGGMACDPHEANPYRGDS